MATYPATPLKRTPSKPAPRAATPLAIPEVGQPVPRGKAQVDDPSSASTYERSGDDSPSSNGDAISITPASHDSLLAEAMTRSSVGKALNRSYSSPNVQADLLSDVGTLGEGIAELSKGIITEPEPESSHHHGVSFVLPPNETDPFHTTSVENLPSNPASAPVSVHEASQGQASTTFQPRPDRLQGEVCSDNAQAFYPPNACVFVANLSANTPDAQLEFEVSQIFQQFGKVYVKIRRDSRGMPYGFCQFENVTDAEKAINFGRGVVIEGRPVRTERAKVNRSLYLSRVAGGPMSEAEAREILRGHGDLETIWVPTMTDKEMFRLPDGIWVQFAFFQDCRDAQAAFKENPRFRLEQPPLPEDLRRIKNSPSPPHSFYGRANGHQSGMMSPSAERPSVFVGNLPAHATQQQVRAIFSQYGKVHSVEIHSKSTGAHATGLNVFAFVDYAFESEARRAIAADPLMDGQRLRVDMRERYGRFGPRSTNGFGDGSPQARRSGAFGSYGRRGFSNRDMAFARALAAGAHPTMMGGIFDQRGFDGTGINAVVPPGTILQALPAPSYFTPPPFPPYSSPGAVVSEPGPTNMEGSLAPATPATPNAPMMPYTPLSGPGFQMNMTPPPYPYMVMGDMAAAPRPSPRT